MATQSGRDHAGQDRAGVCGSDPDWGGGRAGGADYFLEGITIGNGASYSVETADAVGAVGAGERGADAGVWKFCGECAGGLPDGDPDESDDGSDGDQRGAGAAVLIRIPGAAAGCGMVL